MLSKQSWNQMLLHGSETTLACTGICVTNVKDKEAVLAAGEQPCMLHSAHKLGKLQVFLTHVHFWVAVELLYMQRNSLHAKHDMYLCYMALLL